MHKLNNITTTKKKKGTEGKKKKKKPRKRVYVECGDISGLQKQASSIQQQHKAAQLQSFNIFIRKLDWEDYIKSYMQV